MSAYGLDIAWDERGLAPAVVQDAATGQVRMLAWMNAEALERTLESGYAHFFSRSRGALWQKGESSGHVLAVREVRADCDRDAILVLADPAGPTCHTGQASCFFRPAGGDEDGGPPGSMLDRLSATLEERKRSASGKKSYTKSLLEGGFARILEKIAEEHEELAAELPAGEREALVHEAADLLFHVLVGLTARDVEAAEVLRELARRFGVSGHEEKASR